MKGSRFLQLNCFVIDKKQKLDLSWSNQQLPCKCILVDLNGPIHYTYGKHNYSNSFIIQVDSGIRRTSFCHQQFRIFGRNKTAVESLILRADNKQGHLRKRLSQKTNNVFFVHFKLGQEISKTPSRDNTPQDMAGQSYSSLKGIEKKKKKTPSPLC